MKQMNGGGFTFRRWVRHNPWAWQRAIHRFDWCGGRGRRYLESRDALDRFDVGVGSLGTDV
jgi:hypothetical protein